MEKLNSMKFLSALAILTMVPISAQAKNLYELDEVEVTEVRGNKDERTFVETNESVSVLKPKNLNRGDIQNSVQMLNGLANVQTQSDKNGDTFSIRGISDMGVTGYQKDNLASILVDDVFQTSLALKAGSFENWDLETVEVRRGAQSADQGVNSLAGNILLYHYRPSAEKEAVAKLGLGSFGRKDGAFVINRPINDKLFFRASYNKEQSDGFIQNAATNNDKWGERKKDHVVTDLLYRLSSTSDLRLNLKLLRLHKGGSYVQGNYKKYKVTEDQDYKDITNSKQAGLTYTTQLSEAVHNKLIFGATQSDSTTISDEDGTRVNVAGARHGSDKDTFMSVENQLKYKSKKAKNVVGFHLHRYHLNNFYRMNLMATSSIIVPASQENEKTRTTYALFDSFNYDFTNHHTLSLGGRLEIVKNKFSSGIQVPPATPALGSRSGDFGDTATNSIFLPKLGYTYKNDHYSIGSTYSQGYRTGGISVNRWKLETNNYAPEKTHNYELSYKYMRNRLLFAANTFYTKWNDQQVEMIYSNTFDTQVQNASESELYGAEVETSYELDNADSFRMNIGYVKTQFLSFKNQGTTYTGNSFPDAAPVTAQASYWKVLSDKWMLIFVSRYISESFTDPNNRRWSPEQFYTDVNAQYNFDQYMIEFYTRNVFDQKYRIYNGAPRTTNTPYQASYHRVNTPREFGVRANYYW
jgi:iron complex outermembrane receptor protein